MKNFLWFVISLFTVLAMFFAGNESIYFSNRVFITSIIIQIISIYNIFSKDEEPYSLFKMFFLFSLFFFGVAPLMQSFDNSKFWYKRPLFEEEYFFMNILIIFIIIFFKFFYQIFRKSFKVKNKNRFIMNMTISSISHFKIFILILISIFSFFMVFASYNFSVAPMFVRGGELVAVALKNVEEDSSPTKWLIVNNFVRPLSVMCFLFYAVSKRKKIFPYLILLSLALVTCFPTAIPRFAAAAIYIPVLLILFSYVRKKNVFSLIFVFGLLVLFPLLNIFRTYKDAEEFKFKLDFKMFTEAHFDSYQNFALIISNDIITYGRQLLGVMFFWVPRSVWENKPLGSGAFSAHELNFFYDNVATNFFAEGFLNFGFIGIIFFLTCISYITAKWDKIYWSREGSGSTAGSFLTVIYTTSLGFLFFILRGDLMSSLAYMIGYFLSALLVFKITTFKF